MVDESQSVRARVVGLRTCAGPLRDVAVEFGPGVTALYGRNGAGKSWILKAVREAFHGRALPRTHLIVEAPVGTTADQWITVELMNRAYAEGWHEKYGYSRYDVKPGRSTAIGEWFTRGGRYYQPPEDGVAVPEGMVEELVNSRYLALVPVGITEPRWDVWICADPDPAVNPVTTAAIKRYERIERATSALLDVLLEARDCEPTAEEVIMAVARQTIDLEEALAGAPIHESTAKVIEAIWDAISEFVVAVPGPDAAAPTSAPPADAGTAALVEAALDAVGGEPADWLVGNGPLNWVMEPAAGWLWDYESVGFAPDDLNLQSGDLLRPILGDGLPVPIVRVAEAQSIPWVLHDETDGTDVDQLTARRFAAAMASQMDATGDPVAITPFMEDWVAALTTDANQIFESLLQDGPQLTLRLAPTYEWVISAPLHWSTTTVLPSLAINGSLDKREEVKVPLGNLSTAELRWAGVAIRRALDRVPDPRASLHDRAGLSEVFGDEGGFEFGGGSHDGDEQPPG